jgi:hypothetical protein
VHACGETANGFLVATNAYSVMRKASREALSAYDASRNAYGKTCDACSVILDAYNVIVEASAIPLYTFGITSDAYGYRIPRSRNSPRLIAGR